MHVNDGKRQAATLEQQRLVARVLGGWQTAGLNALTARAMQVNDGKRQAATLEQQRLVARVLGGSCREGFCRQKQ